MTQEEKSILLKDLCARLPYGVIIQEYNEEYGYSDNVLNTIGIGYFSIHEASVEGTWINHIENIKPYLRPLSSMTKEEKDEITLIREKDYQTFMKWVKGISIEGTGHICPVTYAEIDFCNTHHFDYRGLIPKGLALEAPEDMYK